MAIDRFFLSALVKKSRRLPAPAAGTWTSDAPKADFLAHLTADILVEGQVQDPRTVSSVPSVFARPIQFVQALSAAAHPLHDALVRQWRGLLSIFALSDYLGLSLTVVPYEVPKKPSPDEVDCNLSTILRNQLPRPAEDWERFFLLYCDGALVGATSPWTVVYTPAQYSCPQTVPWRDGEGLLADPVEHFRKVSGTHVELTLLLHWVDQVLEERWGFERRLDDKAAAIKRELLAFKRDLEKFREAHLQPRGLGAPKIDAWPYRALLRAVASAEESAQAPQSTLLLAATQGEPTLMLPRTGILPTRRVHQSVLYQDLDPARLAPEGKAGWTTPAGKQVPLPYLVPEDVFLPRKLVELSLSDRALQRGQSDYALPLTPAFFRFFRHEELRAQPDLLSITSDRQDILVKLRLPVFGEAALTVERRYRRGIDTVKIPSPVLAVWPDFYATDFQGNLALYNGDAPDVTVRPMLADGALLESSRTGPGPRVWSSAAPPIGFALFQKDAPVGLVLREALTPPEKVRADREWIVAVDFGTSNTHILLDEGQGPPQPLRLGGRTLCLTQAREELKEALRYFYPTEAPKLPLVTLLVENSATQLGDRQGDRYAPVFIFYPDLLTSQSTVKNVKWGGAGGAGGTDAEAPLREYLRGLLRYISCEARARGVGSLQLRWSFPMALPEGVRGAMAAFWQSVDPLTPTIKVLPAQSAPESEAACRYLGQPKLNILPVGSRALSIVVDVGGGSSDFGFWTQGRLVEQLSFYLAANHITENLVGLEGLAHTLFRICSGQIESTYEAVRPAFESQPTIMFNAIVSQARGWPSDNPQEHPVVRELFGGTLAPHGGPPWVHARSLIYILFSSLAFYCGIHARKLLLADLGKLPALAAEDRRFFLYFGGRGSSLLSWLSRSGEVLQQLLGSAFQEGLLMDDLLRGYLDPARLRIEVMGPAIVYKEKAPPKEEVAGGLLCAPQVVPGGAGGAQDPPREAALRKETVVGERGWVDAGGKPVLWDEAVDHARLRGLRVRPAGERYIDRFVSRVLRMAAPGGALQELNLDLRPEALQVDSDQVQHRLHHSPILQPVFVHEVEALLQAYLEALPQRKGR